MQQSNEAPAEPSMEDILASIRKIISEEPAAAKQNFGARPPGKQPPVSQGAAQAPAVQYPVTPPQSDGATQSRLSDIVRELAPAAVPVSVISTASFHDDMADLVEGGGSSAAPSMKLAEASFKASAPEANPFRPIAPSESAVAGKPAPRPEPVAPAPVARTAPNIPAPILAPQASSTPAPAPQKVAADFGAFIPSSAESIGMTSPRPLPISLGSEFRNVEPVRVPAPVRIVKPDPQPAIAEASATFNGAGSVAGDDDSEMASAAAESDPVAAAQSALGALAMGFAAPAPMPANTSVSTVAPVQTEVAVRANETPAAVETGRKSLDDSIVDMLRPMLRDWLDSHLPEMVEKALTQELRDRRN